MTVTFQRFHTLPGVRVFHPGDEASLPDLTAQVLMQRGIAIQVATAPSALRETTSRKRKKETRSGA